MSEAGDTYVKFNGASASVEEIEADLGAVVKFSGVGEVVGIATVKRTDGERRPVVTVKVGDVEIVSILQAPKEDQLPFDEDPPSLGSDEPGDAA